MRSIKRKIILIVTVTLSLLFFTSPQSITFAQTVEEDVSTQPPSGETQGPEVIQEQQKPPWYYYWPEENLNPYGLSTMGDGTDSGNFDTGSTLGRTTRRPSNLEVNPPSSSLKSQEPDDQEALTDEEIDNNLGDEDIIDVESPPANKPRGQIYTYTDEKGVLHVTNDISSIPSHYQHRILGESKGSKQEQ